MFSIFGFPVNFPSPILNALGGVYFLVFLFKIFFFAEEIIGFKFPLVFTVFQPLVYVVVFFIILVVGYVKIFKAIKPKKEIKKKTGIKEKEEREKKKKEKEEEEMKEKEEREKKTKKKVTKRKKK